MIINITTENKNKNVHYVYFSYSGINGCVVGSLKGLTPCQMGITQHCLIRFHLWMQTYDIIYKTVRA